jgi:hypothetical protein
MVVWGQGYEHGRQLERPATNAARVRETVLQMTIRDVSAEWKARANIAAYLVDAGPQEADLDRT